LQATALFHHHADADVPSLPPQQSENSLVIVEENHISILAPISRRQPGAGVCSVDAIHGPERHIYFIVCLNRYRRGIWLFRVLGNWRTGSLKPCSLPSEAFGIRPDASFQFMAFLPFSRITLNWGGSHWDHPPVMNIFKRDICRSMPSFSATIARL